MSELSFLDDWSRDWYFDQRPNLDAYRVAQSEKAYGQVFQLADWFLRPPAEIAQYLHLLAWVTGAGKTHAVNALAFAYNCLHLDRNGRAPRIARVLVLTKERAIRDQLAYELATEITRFGIATSAPQVGLLADALPSALRRPNIRPVSYDELGHPLSVGRFDIVVGCQQSFWKDNIEVRSGLSSRLAFFQMVYHDEPHFALNQVHRVMALAPHAVHFGGSASAIYPDGKPSKGFVLFSVYDYPECSHRDGCLKYLSDDPEAGILKEVELNSATVQQGGHATTVRSCELDGYDKNLYPSLTVAYEVAMKLLELDQYCALIRSAPERATLAPHRPEGVVPSILYPAHAIITADTIDVATSLQRYLNSVFEGHPETFPREQGWRAEVAHSGTEDARGRDVKAEPLSPDHPWLFASQNRGNFRDGKKAVGSRILVVVDMGREGVNNPYCCVAGVACPARSQVEYAQRPIGRPIRAVVEKVGGKVVRCAPEPLDTVHIITHPAFGNRHWIVRAMRYTLNMAEHLEGLPTVEDLMAGKAPEDRPAAGSTADELSLAERLAVCSEIGELRSRGLPVDLDRIASRVDDGSPKRHENAKRWGSIVLEDPAAASRGLGLIDAITPVPVVTHEQAQVMPTDDELLSWMGTHYPHRTVTAQDIRCSALARGLCLDLFAQARRQFLRVRPDSNTSLEALRGAIRARVLASLGVKINPRAGGDAASPVRNRVFPLVGTAVKMLFGCPPGQSVAADSVYNTPYHHAILSRPEYRRLVVGWVHKRLIAEGYFGALAHALQVPTEANPSGGA